MTSGASTPTAATGPLHCGLRERKKARTRDALLRAALALFGTHGYDTTTVRQIADAAEVSERTFFRYFAGKEDLVLSQVIVATEQFIAELTARPITEKPADAMRQALRAALGWLRTEHGGPGDNEFAFGAVVDLIESTPALLATQLRQIQESGDRVAAVLATRSGLPATDPRPQVLQAVFAATVMVALKEWRGQGGLDRLDALTDRYLDQLPGLTGHWS